MPKRAVWGAIIWLILLGLACNLPAATDTENQPGDLVATQVAGTLAAMATPATSEPLPTATASAPAVLSLTGEMLRNATYPFNDPPALIQLTNGEHREFDPNQQADRVTELHDNYGFGDLNGDGVEDAAVILTIHTSNTTGHFYYLGAVINQGGVATPVATIFLGDRVLVQAIEIVPGGIMLDIVIHSPTGPLCCPDLPVIQTYAFEGDALRLVTQVDAPE